MSGSTIAALSYVRVTTGEPAASARFAADILGLQRVAEQHGEIAFRSDHRFHTFCIVPEGSGERSVGLELPDEQALEHVARALECEGFSVSPAEPEAVTRRYVRSAYLARDGSGNAFDLVLGPHHSGRRYFPTRDAGVIGLHDVGMRSIDMPRDLVFWTKVLGAKVSDWVGDITYLRFDSSHHRVALYPSRKPGILYVSFGVESLDNVMQNHYFMQERQIRIVQGPGRQPASGQIFLHIEGPDGIIYSYVNGMDELDGRVHRPRQFQRVAHSLCAWGSECDGVPELSPAES